MLNVVIDTSIFRGESYNWNSQKLKALKNFKKKNLIKVYIPEIIDQEIKLHLSKNATEAREELIKTFTKFKSFPKAFNDRLDECLESIELLLRDNSDDNILVMEYLRFKDELKLEIIKTNPGKINEVLHKYFFRKPPFVDKKDKKKEFPDAFAIESVKSFFSDQYCVVSNDGGWGQALMGELGCCFFHNLNEFIDFVEKEDKKQQAIRKIIQNNKNIIFDYIEDIFENRGFMMDDVEDEYIYDVQVDTIKIQDIVIESEDGCKISASGEVLIYYSASADYSDPDSWTRDSDTKEIFYREKITGDEINRVETASGFFDFCINPETLMLDGPFHFNVELPDYIVIHSSTAEYL